MCVMLSYSLHLKKIARLLRKQMTETEIRLWNQLKNKQLNDLLFYRQRPIGKYIVDFYCPSRKLVIEIDGSQHYEEDGEKKDKERDEYLEKLGIKVLRCTNLDIYNNLEGVIGMISETTQIPPLIPPSSKGEA